LCGSEIHRAHHAIEQLQHLHDEAAARIADAPSPDAELLDLGREWSTSAAREDRAREALWAAEERYADPEVPEALFHRPGDFRFFFGFQGCGYHFTDRRWYGAPSSIAYLRAAPLCRMPEFHLDDGTVVPAKPNLAARARRDEIVGAYDRWSAERKATQDACGLTAANEEEDAANEDNRELRHRIMATPALTLAGVMLKARIAGWCFGGSVEMNDYVESYLKEGNLSGEAVAFSAVRDLVAMLEWAAA
jgi:hypothetical protein